MAQELLIKIVGDSSSYERSLGRANKATNTFNANIGKTTKASQALRGSLSTTSVGGGLGGLLFGSTAFVGAAVASKAIGTAISAASDMNEQLSKSNVVFGKSAQVISDWSQTTSTAFGISRVEAVKAAATFGSLFANTGQTQAAAAEMSKTVVELAGDLASFNNTSTSEALDALRSGLSGEIEPLRRFQVFLTEASVAQRAMADTGKTSVQQLTQGEKITARYELILQQTTKAQGDFNRTSSSLANQQRVLTAQTADLAAKAGTVLLPAVTSLVTALNDAFDAVGLLAGALGKLAQTAPIEIPVKLVRDHTDGFGASVLRHIVLGEVSPLALGITIGKEIVDGITQGAADLRQVPGGNEQARGFAGGEAAAVATKNAAAAAAAIDKATKRANASLSQQISDSATRIAHLKDLIREDPSNAKLQQRLTAEIKTQNALLGQQKSLNESNAAAAKSAAQAAHDASVQAAADRKQAQKDAEQARREQVKRTQFKALGLTGEGLKPTPGSGSLLKRATGLQDRIKGTVLDTAKNRSQLKTIVNFLKKNFNKAGKDVREAILGMLNEISGAFKDGAKKDVTGPLTKTHGLNTKKLVQGLGLTPEAERELRGRLSHFNTAGRALGGSKTTAPGGSRVPGQRGPSEPSFVANVNVYIDGKKVSNTVTKQQQKDRRRNPPQKRGPHSGHR